jgi:Zn-dependent protease
MDLKVGSIPLQVQPRFLLMALLLGLNERDPGRLAVWVAVVLVSIFVHEMGHALMGMAFGFKPAIVIHGMGGHTTFGNGRWTASTGRSILISLAGPFAGFVFAAVVKASLLAGFSPHNPLVIHAVQLLLEVNVVWGIFNLMPMLPLDGGNVMRSVATKVSPNRGEKVSRVISVILAAVMGLWAITGGQWWLVYLAALYGFQNFQAVRQQGQRAVDSPLANAVERSYGALNRGDTKEAIALLGPVLFNRNTDPDVRRAGLEVYVVALMKEERWGDVVRAIERDKGLIGADNLTRFSKMLRKAGREAEASTVESFTSRQAATNDHRA